MHDIVCGDALAVLLGLADASVDAVVTDPPYALAFMGARWDTGLLAHDRAFWAEVLRVAKPGAFLLAFGGTRTYHRLACAIEDAGWELRDMLNWLYSSGFPKSKSCLKPAHEPIVLAKAPGALRPLQIDACRVATDEYLGPPVGTPVNAYEWSKRPNPMAGQVTSEPSGRWPPNTLLSHHPDCQPQGVRRLRGNTNGSRGVQRPSGFAMGAQGPQHYADAEGYEQVQAWSCHPQCAIRLLDEQAGPRKGAVSNGSKTAAGLAGTATFKIHERPQRPGYADNGPCSRFFPTFAPDPEDAVPLRYVPKAPARERRLADGTPTRHPTQKPVALAQWLAALVCQPGGTVLDPFAGVASLGIGALRAGCHYLGIEQDAVYAATAQQRLDEEIEQQTGPLFAGLADRG